MKTYSFDNQKDMVSILTSDGKKGGKGPKLSSTGPTQHRTSTLPPSSAAMAPNRQPVLHDLALSVESTGYTRATNTHQMRVSDEGSEEDSAAPCSSRPRCAIIPRA